MRNNMNMRIGMNRRQFMGAVGAGAAGLVGTAMMGSGVASAMPNKPPTAGTMLKTIKDRGYMKVSVASGSAPGFLTGQVVNDPVYGRPIEIINAEGIEADFARAIAVAIWGDELKILSSPKEVSFSSIKEHVDRYLMLVPTTSSTRFNLLFNKVNHPGLEHYVPIAPTDIVLRSVTNTYSRDSYFSWAYEYPPESKIYYTDSGAVEFGPTYYYDGVDILLYSGYINQTTKLPSQTLNIAVADRTAATSYDAITTALGNFGLTGYFNLIEVGTSDDAKAAFLAGLYGTTTIHGYGIDTSDLIGTQLGMTASTERYFAAYQGVLASKEPLAPCVREGDPNWSDIVRQVMNVLVEAEEAGITKSNIDRNFKNWGVTVSGNLGLASAWPRKVIKAVGNFGEIWNRNLYQPAWAPRAINETWLNGGLLYSPAFR